MGRPSLYSDDLHARVTKLVRAGVDELDAFMLEGVSRTTFFAWKKDAKKGVEPFSTLFEDVETAAAGRNSRLTLQLMKLANAGNLEAITRALKAYRPDLFNDRQRVELGGLNGNPIVAGIRYVVHVPEDEPEEQDP